ncbi:LpxL/LpxP family acyltransferase [Methylococcus mesophilus]|uniref:LpxL/LpxP family acyltransferase n=1 Tax=Methylococcus mesophilus TaxID=2993564 RepID=UPI00224B21D5|nr:acyl-CoA synthetase [Methylococcus mesophilus]UZR30010.1 acyl-CoA synthetase [Methylococcus mesophilus]
MNDPSSPRGLGAAPHWAERPERSNMFFLRIMAWISLRLGRRAGRLVLHLIVVYFLLFAPSAHRASRNFLRRVLGCAPGLADCYRHFFRFASTIHDRVYLLNGQFSRFDIRIVGEEAMERVLAEGRGAFLLGAHFGSFEVLRAVARQRPGLEPAMVMYEENARKINAMLAAIAPGRGGEVIPLGRVDSMLRLREALDRGKIVGMLGDRSLGSEPAQQLPFLGGLARFPTGPLRMAALMKRPVLLMAGIYLGGNRYELHFERLEDFSDGTGDRSDVLGAAMARYVERLESLCRTHPYNWFNFFDFWAAGQARTGRAG